MPVAVRLVEALALITVLGILTGFSIFVVLAQRTVTIAFALLNPLTQFVSMALSASEKILVNILTAIINLTRIIV